MTANPELGEMPAGPTLHELFHRQAMQRPNRIALSTHEHDVTYRDLDLRSDAVAARLIREGVKLGAVVGLRGHRGIDLVAGLIGVAKAGAAALYLDPALPNARIRAMTTLVPPALILTDDVDRSRSATGCTALSLAALSTAEEVHLPEIAPDSVSAVYFTSGSSGAPKSVATTHRNVVSRLIGQGWTPTDEDTVLQHSPLSWDAGTFELWAPLVTGGRTVLYQGPPADLSELHAAIVQLGTTYAFLTASLLNLVIDERPEILAGLRVLITGGETASAAHLSALRSIHPALALLHAYGPVETTIFATIYEVPPGPAPVESPLPIGRPITNAEVYIVDPDLQPLAAGEVGEICIGGDGVAVGYLGDDELNRAKFVELRRDQGTLLRAYRTGDLGLIRADGNVEFHGRMDHQLKIRGHRIDVTEVEGALQQVSGVRQVVVDVQGSGDGRTLIGYVVTGSAGRDLVDLRLKLSELLPDYLVPAAIVSLSSLPLTSTGKLDRDQLPARRRDPGPGPESELEVRVIDILRKVLQVEAISPLESIIDLGGNSLHVARIVQQLRRSVTPAVTVKTVFLNPTARSLVAALKDAPPVPTQAG
jgi:amino acid adenylation domain-containing protein